MDPDLTAIKAALAESSDTELAALIAATYGVPQTAPGLLAWIDSACEWELNRRHDFDYPLQPPEAAIVPSEDGVSISAAVVMVNQFAQDAPAVRVFFDALVEILTGSGWRQYRSCVSGHILDGGNSRMFFRVLGPRNLDCVPERHRS